jgi:hypothetical protein
MSEADARAVCDRWQSVLPYQWRLVPAGDGYGLKTDAELTKAEWEALFTNWMRHPQGMPALPQSVWTWWRRGTDLG